MDTCPYFENNQGEEWAKFRQAVQQDMMRPSSAFYYIRWTLLNAAHRMMIAVETLKIMMQWDWGDLIGVGWEDCLNEGPIWLCSHQQGWVTLFSTCRIHWPPTSPSCSSTQNQDQACQEFALESIGLIFLGSRLGRIHHLHHPPILIIIKMNQIKILIIVGASGVRLLVRAS